MSLSIFAFDIESLINTWSNFFDQSEIDSTVNETVSNQIPPETNFQSEQMLSDSAIKVILTSSPVGVSANSPITSAIVKPANISDAHRKLIEELAATLQSSLTHTYQMSDISNGKISRNIADNLLRKQTSPTLKETSLDEDNRKRELKMKILQEEMRKSIIKSSKNYPV